MAAGSNLKSQKKFQNVVNSPLLIGRPDQKVLGLVSVPELHLLIGM